ncbi:hypothetical protein KY345_05955 [Candidatus Woesearchaeota archaeon]|nr:hypothetical protein [Candidatus Woesearchaeota archaeon]
MRKIIMLFLLLIMSSMVFASIDSDVKCLKKSCVEGSMAHWTVSVYNNINSTIVVEYVRMVDENSYSVAYYDAEGEKTLEHGERYVYEFDQLIVAPPSGYTWYYKPCMRVRLEGGTESVFVCKDTVKTFSVLPRDKAECLSDKDCALNEKCDEYTLKCTELSCITGEAVKDHECISGNLYNKIPSSAKIAILAAIVVVLIIIIAAVATMRAGDEDEENWYEEETGKAKKSKKVKKKAKKRKR